MRPASEYRRECKQDPARALAPRPRAAINKTIGFARLSASQRRRLTTCPVQTNCGTEIEPGDHSPGLPGEEQPPRGGC